AAFGGSEELVERDAELADDRVQRAHGRLGLPRLDLRDEAGRDLEPAGQLAQRQAAALALRPQARAERVLAICRRAGRSGLDPAHLNSENTVSSGKGAASAAASTS